MSVDVCKIDGTFEGTEVVHTSDDLASAIVPNHQLRGFDKVVISASNTKTVRFPIQMEDLGLWNSRMNYVVEAGSFTVLVGSSSGDQRKHHVHSACMSATGRIIQ